MEIDGRFWWTAADKNKADQMKEEYTKNIRYLRGDIYKLNQKLNNTTDIGKQRIIQAKMAVLKDRIGFNKLGITNIETLENDPDHGFSYNFVDNEKIELLEYAGKQVHEQYGLKDKVIINYHSESNATHETSHGRDVADGLLIPVKHKVFIPNSQYSYIQGELNAYMVEFGIHGIPNNYNSDKPLPTMMIQLDESHIRGFYYYHGKTNTYVYPYKNLP